MTIIITACITHCPRMVPCVRQMLHKWPGREPVAQFNNRNKMSFIPKKQKREAKAEEHLGGIWCGNREPDSSRGPVVMTGVQER